MRLHHLSKKLIISLILLVLLGSFCIFIGPYLLSFFYLELGGCALDHSLVPVFEDRLAPEQIIDREGLQRGHDYLQKALVWDVENVQAMRLLARVYLSQGQPEKALWVLQQASDLRPASLILYLEIGDVYDALGKSKLAVEAYEEGRIGSRQLPAAANYLKLAEANIAADSGGEKAIALWKRVLDLDPTNLYALSRLKASYVLLGDVERAAFYQEQIQDIAFSELSVPLDFRLADYQGQAMVLLVEEGIWNHETLYAIVECQVAGAPNELSRLMIKQMLGKLLLQWPEDERLRSLGVSAQ